MNIKRFRTVCNITSILMKIIAGFCILVLLVMLSTSISSNSTFVYTFEVTYFPIFNALNGPLNASETQLASLIIFPFTASIYSFIFIRGGQLFKYLAKGTSPFELTFAKKVKQISLLLILSDIFLPLVYSLLVTVIMEGSYYILVGLSSSFIIGLILYAVSEILNYGIELQKLSDNTI